MTNKRLMIDGMLVESTAKKGTSKTRSERVALGLDYTDWRDQKNATNLARLTSVKLATPVMWYVIDNISTTGESIEATMKAGGKAYAAKLLERLRDVGGQ